jgi:uncharacterized protein YceK
MKIAGNIRVILVAALVILSATGCATYTTISASDARTAKVFSGTRLDAMAIAGIPAHTEKFKVSPPASPALDIPFSFMLDAAIFPLTFSVALYEFIFE